MNFNIVLSSKIIYRKISALNYIDEVGKFSYSSRVFILQRKANIYDRREMLHDPAKDETA